MSAAAPVEVSAACVGCGACIATCPERAFRAVRALPPLVVLADRCTACLACIEVCPEDAIGEVRASPGAAIAVPERAR